MDMSGFPLWELQLFRFDTHILRDAGVNVPPVHERLRRTHVAIPDL